MVETLENGTFWVRRFEVASHSNPDKSYVVALNTNNEWGCSCPVWKFRRQECKHQREVFAAINNQTAVVEFNRAELMEKTDKKIRLSSTVTETEVPSRFTFVEV